MLARVERFGIVGPFRLEVQFRDGSAGVHDFSGMVTQGGGLIEAIRDKTFFDRVFLDFGALTWPNGFDIAPEWLRREMLASGELKQNVAAE